MDNEPKNVILLLNGDKMKASIERDSKTYARSMPLNDYPVSGYTMKFAVNGGYIVQISYEGTQETDFLAFRSKEDLLEALNTILK
jgi:hypothetical protein